MVAAAHPLLLTLQFFFVCLGGGTRVTCKEQKGEIRDIEFFFFFVC